MRDKAEKPAPEAPGQETASVGPGVGTAFADARRRLCEAPTRNDKGQFVPGNPGPMLAGLRSQQLRPVLDELAGEEEAAILVDLGGPDNVSVACRALVRGLAQEIVIRDAAWAYLLQTGGQISTKGRIRPIVRLHGERSDRVARLAKDVGLQRRARSITDLSAEEYLRAQRAQTSEVTHDRE